MSCGTLDPCCSPCVSSTRLSLSLVRLPRQVRLHNSMHYQVLHPPLYFYIGVWALSVSLTTTTEIDYFLSFPPVTEMFHFTGFPSHTLFIHVRIPTHYRWRVSSFGHLRLIAHLQLTAAFRSLSRPSSAPSAKASTIVTGKQIGRAHV